MQKAGRNNTIATVIAIAVIVLILVLLSAMMRRDEPVYEPYATATEALTVLPDSSANKVKTRKKKEKKEEPKRRRPQQRSFLDEPVTSESE